MKSKSFTVIKQNKSETFQIIIPKETILSEWLTSFTTFPLSIFAKQFFTHINFPSGDIVKLFPLDIKLRYFRQDG